MWQGTKIFGVPIHGYGLMIVIGFLLILYVGEKEVKRRQIPNRLHDVAMVFLLCGIFGARVFYFIQFYSSDFAAKESPFLEFFKIWEGGLVFYGGAIGALLGGVFFIRWKKLPMAEYMDISAMLSLLGMAFGRLGCFLNGCCWGKICDPDFPLSNWWHFPAHSPAARQHDVLGWISSGQEALAVHPVQLYQAGHDFLLFVGLYAFQRYGHPPKGAGMPLAIVFYSIGRFMLEGLRGDNPLTPTGLTISQNVAVAAVVVFGAVTILMLWRDARSRRRAPEFSPPHS